MIEVIDNAIQLVTTGICTGIAFYRSLLSKERAWVLLGLFSGCYFLGVLYYVLFLGFYQEAPKYYSASDVSWYTSYLFLLLLLIYLGVERHENDYRNEQRAVWGMMSEKAKENAKLKLFRPRPVLLCVPVFTGGMCIFFMQRGEFFVNTLIAILMTCLIALALDGLLSLREQTAQQNAQAELQNKRKMLYIATLLFCFTEYALWTSSCFWTGYSLKNIYYWFDFLLSLSFLLFVPALRKAVDR